MAAASGSADTALPEARFVRTTPDGKRHGLVFVDGCCLGNGTARARGGWAIVYGPGLVASGRLKDGGEGGITNNRAELSAAIAALEMGETWQRPRPTNQRIATLVLASDSRLLVDGLTEWAPLWVKNGWKTARGGARVKNVDLWKRMLDVAAALDTAGVRVSLWKVPRGWNGVADRAARAAAEGNGERLCGTIDVEKDKELLN